MKREYKTTTVMQRALTTLLLLIGVTAAATAQTPKVLTMEQAIATAIQNNRDLKISRLEIENADARVDEAYSNALPSVGLNGRYTFNIAKQVFYIPGQDGIVRPIEIGSDNALQADITVNQIIYNQAAFDAPNTAKVYSQISRQQLRATASDVILTVKRAFYTAMLTKEYLLVSEQLLANSEETFKNAQTLYKAGVRAEFDAIRAEVQVANQKPAVVQARDNYNQALDGLKLAMGIPETEQIDVAERVARPASLERVEPQVEEAKKLLEEYNPQLQALALNDEVNQQLIDIKRSDYLPTVGFFGTYQYSAQADKLGDLEFQPTAYVGLNLSLSLYNGGKTKAQEEQARVEKEKSKLQLENARNGLRTQIETILRRIDFARQRIAATDRVIDQADKGYKIAQASYKAGTGTQLQINDADIAMAQSKWNQMTAINDYNVAIAELEALLGQRYQITSDGNDVKYSQN